MAQEVVQEAMNWLLQHGYALLAGAVLAEQLGTPLPAAPFLLGMGALAGLGHFNLLTALALSSVAGLAGDLVWYWLGRARGDAVLGLLCRLSFEPDTCVRLTYQSFDRYGQASLLFCKFVPGLSTVAPPLAGITGVSLGRFILLSLTGSALWAGSFLGIGWLFREQLERALELLSRFGMWMFVALAAPLALWIGWKYAQRWLFIRRTRAERVSPERVMALLEGPTPPVIIDLRSQGSVERSGWKIAGARLGAPENAAALIGSLPPGTLLVFYCNCPNDAASATQALKLRRAGCENAVALDGGIDAWTRAGYPLEAVEVALSGEAALSEAGS